MSTSVELSFIKNFQAEVHVQYQRMGSKLRNTVRTHNNVRGATDTYQKVGKGTAGTKARHGLVPVMNIDHTPIECVLQDFYAGDWVDKLDELKLNIDEQQVTAKSGAYALGRKTDELLLNAMSATTTATTVDGTSGLTLPKVLQALELLGNADVPDDGQRYAVVGWRQWADLLQIDEFADSAYVGEDNLPWKGTQAKQWLGTLWMPHSGLTKDGSNDRHCFWYHKTALGHSIGADVMTDITWHGDRAAHFINNMMSQGACLIDTTGVVRMKAREA